MKFSSFGGDDRPLSAFADDHRLMKLATRFYAGGRRLTDHLIELTADIVSAHVSNNSVKGADLANLIQTVFAALAATSSPEVSPAEQQQPAVSVRSSVKHDYLVCLEDGSKLKMLKRYLRTNFGMSPDEYRAKWGLPRDYPMVAPAYAEKRRELAKQSGLGRISGTAVPNADSETVGSDETVGASLHFPTVSADMGAEAHVEYSASEEASA